MQKHFKRVGGGLLAIFALGSGLLMADIPTALEQADKSFSFMAKSFGYNNPPDHFITTAWSHPWVVALSFAVVFAIGVGISWGLEKLWIWLRKKPTPDSPPVPESDDAQALTNATALPNPIASPVYPASVTPSEGQPLRTNIDAERAAKEASDAATIDADNVAKSGWLPLHDVIKRIAFESEWAHGYDVEYANALIRPDHSLTTEMKWHKDLRQQFLFYAPEMISRGIHQAYEQRSDNGLSDITADFWQKAEIEVVDMLATDFASVAFIPKKEVFRYVVFDKKQVEEKWPKSTNPLPTHFKKLIEPYLQEADYNAQFNEAAWGNIA